MRSSGTASRNLTEGEADGRRTFVIAARFVGLVAMVLCSTGAAAAQESVPEASSWEFRLPGGAFVPTGDQRQDVRDAQVLAAQLSRVVRPSLALTGTFAWARSRDLASADAPKLDVFTSDLGVEVRSGERSIGGGRTFRPFGGMGAGVRSYNHRTLNVDATSRLAGYGSVGGVLGWGRVGLRLEVRDYVTVLRPLAGAGDSRMRNDIAFLAALRISRHRALDDQD